MWVVGAIEVAGANPRDEALEALARRRGPRLVVGLDRRALGILQEAIGGANDRRAPVSAPSVGGERVQVALRLVALRQLGRIGAPQGVGLVVDHQRALGQLGQQVDLPAHDRSPQPERERDLRPDSRAACLELRAKLRGEPTLDQRLDPVAGLSVAVQAAAGQDRLQLGAAGRGPGASRARLEGSVHRVADRQRALARPRGGSGDLAGLRGFAAAVLGGPIGDGRRREADHPLDVEAVAAAGVGGERGI